MSKQKSGMTVVPVDEDGDTELHVAIIMNDIEHVFNFLLKNDLWRQPDYSIESCSRCPLVNITNNLGQTPLYLATVTGQERLVNALLSAGADASIKCWRTGRTALHEACLAEWQNLAIVRAILFHQRSSDEQRILVNDKDKHGKTVLHSTVEAKRYAELELLLSVMELDLNATQGKDGKTAMCLASENNEMEIVKLLLQRGALVNVKSFSGFTAFDFARDRQNLSIMIQLAKAGAKQGASILDTDAEDDEDYDDANTPIGKIRQRRERQGAMYVLNQPITNCDSDDLVVAFKGNKFLKP